MPDKFPTSPSDGDQHTTVLGTIYQYLAADNKWYIVVTTITHNGLDGLNDGNDYEHITQDQKNLLHAVYTDTDVEGIINAEIVNGQSIDNAIDALISTHTLTNSERVKAGFNLSGGGDISFGVVVNKFKWTSRFIIIAHGSGSHFSTDGYFDITQPTTGTCMGVGGADNQTWAANGITLNSWTALYYILPIGSTFTSIAANFRLVYYTSDIEIPAEWILVAIRNGDDITVKTGTGIFLDSGKTWTASLGHHQKHNDLSGIDDGDINHLTDDQVSALHVATVGGDLTHDSITLPNGNANEQHLTAAQVGALHAKQHAMDNATYHTRGDNAVLDSSTNFHGFLKKLDDDNTHFMDGQGNWSVPTGSGFMSNVVEDTTPQLGGDLDLNGHNITFPSVVISDVKDEDDMSSNSPTMLATQQSIRAYIATRIDAHFLEQTWGDMEGSYGYGASAGSIYDHFNPKCRMKTGTYTGNNAADRTITVGFQPIYLVIAWFANGVWGIKHITFPTKDNLAMHSIGRQYNTIEFVATGFKLAPDSGSTYWNTSPQTYTWVAYY